jgi:hypothetical protein
MHYDVEGAPWSATSCFAPVDRAVADVLVSLVRSLGIASYVLNTASSGYLLERKKGAVAEPPRLVHLPRSRY